MIRNNVITDKQILLGPQSQNQMGLISADVVYVVLVFGYVAATTGIVLQHAVPLNL